MAQKQQGAGMYTIEAFGGTFTIDVDNQAFTIVENYIVLVYVKDRVSYDDGEVKVSQVPIIQKILDFLSDILQQDMV